MQIDSIISKTIKDNYGLNVISAVKIKNIYKIYAKEGTYCLKIIKYEFPHFNFILNAIIHLERRGFNNIPEIFITNNNKHYIQINNKFAYLTPWINSRESNYDSILELKRVASKLGEMHRCSEGFTITNDMKPRIGWFSWIKVFQVRRSEILDFKNRISQKAYKSEFDEIYLGIMEDELKKCDRSIEIISNSKYMALMEREVLKRGFCHHDYANHNVLISKNNIINIIDFDYCILDTHIHDVASLMIRAMRGDKWSEEVTNCIIDGYRSTNNVTNEELNVIRGFLKFPQEYWQLGIQKYWEQQPWDEEKFLKRLEKYVNDSQKRNNFIEKNFV